jgi:putative MATE family efflux protein
MVARLVRRWLGGFRERDLTRGSLVGSLLTLSLPMVAGSVAIGVVFQVVDLAFLSLLGQAELSAVIMVNQTVWQIVTMVMMGLNFATQSMIARAIGSGDRVTAEDVGGQSLLLGGLLSVVVALAGGFFAEELFGSARPDPSFVPFGANYLRILTLLSFGLFGSMMLRAVLVGAGDTLTPLLANLVQVAVALFMEWVLIFGNLGAPALGVRGVAIAVSLGQVSALVVAGWVIFGGRARIRLRPRNLRPNPGLLLALGRSAWPPAVQMLGMVATSFALLRLTGSFGPTVQTAYSIGLRLGLIIPAFSFPLATACATLVGQALGAGNVPRAWRAIGTGIAVHGAVMWVFALSVFVWRRELISLITADPGVIEVGSEYLAFSAGIFALMGFNMVVIRALQGAGDFIAPMFISLGSTFVVGIPSAYFLSGVWGPTGIWTGSLLGATSTTVAMGAWMWTGRWATRGVALMAARS